MEEEKIEKNKKPIFVFFWKMFFIFLGIDLISIFISNIIGGTSFVEKYGQELIVELFYGLTILVVMLLFKNSYVFTNKKDKFSVGIKIAGPMLIVIAINLLSSITAYISLFPKNQAPILNTDKPIKNNLIWRFEEKTDNFIKQTNEAYREPIGNIANILKNNNAVIIFCTFKSII